MPSTRQTVDAIQNCLDKWMASVSDYSIYAVSAEGRVTWNAGGTAIFGSFLESSFNRSITVWRSTKTER